MKFKKPYLLKIFKSHYCKFIFLIALIGVYLLTPKKIFYGPYYTALGILFIIMTSLTLTCFIRSIKDRVLSAKAGGASLLGILSIVFGFGALQACTIGVPACGATVGGGVIAFLFPALMHNLIEQYSLWIIGIYIVLQILALYSMKCFKFKHKGVQHYNKDHIQK